MASQEESTAIHLQEEINHFFSDFPVQSHHEAFREFHIDSRRKLSDLLVEFSEADGVEDALKLAKNLITERNFNPNLVKMAFGIYLTHSKDAHRLGVVAPSLLFHSHFRTELPGVPLSNPIAADAMKGVEVVSYFREDYDFNDHHYHWHYVYPYTGIVVEKQRQRVIDRQGELFLYMHSQMLARYDAELLSWGLDLTHPWGYDDILTSGYTPPPGLRDTYSSRPPFQGWYEDHNPNFPDKKAPPNKKELIRWRNNIFRAIESGYFVTTRKDGSAGKFLLTADNAHNWVGIVVEGEDPVLQEVDPGDSEKGKIDQDLYGGPQGGLHNNGHDKFAAIGAPSVNDMGVMSTNVGSPRDPCFWLWHRHIDEFRHNVTRKYTHDVAEFQPKAKLLNVKIMPQNPKSTTPAGGITTTLKSPMLLTFSVKTGDKQTITNLSGLPGVLKTLDKPEVTRIYLNECNAKLDHEPYQWEVTVKSTRIPSPTKDNPQTFTVRLFIIPTPLIQDQREWIEMDKFTHTLTEAQESITRIDTMSSVARKNVIPGSKPSAWCLCGWPQSMMLPVGKPEGADFTAFAMLTDDKLEKDPTTNAISFCGAKSEKYPDPRGMGYPFDKTWAQRTESADSVQKIVEKQPHMMLYDFKVYRTTTLYEGQKIPPGPPHGNIKWSTIKGFFTIRDIECMKVNGPFDLSKYEDVKNHSNQIYAATSSGRMPKGEDRWSQQKCAQFHTWMMDGCPE